MKEVIRKKMETIVQYMEYGLSFPKLKEIAPSKTTRNAIFAYFDQLDIKYKKIEFSKKRNDFKFKLISDYRDSIIKIEDHDDSVLKDKFNYVPLLETLKVSELTPSQICETLNCKDYVYKNVITYLTKLYPIYETDDGRIGYLTI